MATEWEAEFTQNGVPIRSVGPISAARTGPNGRTGRLQFRHADATCRRLAMLRLLAARENVIRCFAGPR